MALESPPNTFWCQRPGCYVERPLPKYSRRDRPGGIYCMRSVAWSLEGIDGMAYD